MKEIYASILIFLLSLSFISCGFTSEDGGSVELNGSSVVGDSMESGGESASDDGAEKEKYTVTWKNYDGTVLEVDEAFKGATPTYDSEIPQKPADGSFTYTFGGWSPTVCAVSADAVYTATFKSVYNGQSVVGMQPTLTEHGSVLYGLYPQSYVSDAETVATLNALSPSEINGWYFYEGEYYAKESASVYNNEAYTFDDGTAIVNGGEYWFKCQPIEWEILTQKNGGYYLLSTLLLDAQAYYADYETRTIDGQTVYANDYVQSDIRAWLNGAFYQTAFALNNTYVVQTTVENGAATTNLSGNPYGSENTLDNVFLPSFADYLTADYGFVNSAEKSTTRTAKTTDYARATGAWCHTRNNTDKATRHNGSYWTRSADGEYDYCVSVVNSGGFMSAYTVDEESHSVRPSICLTADAIKK